LRPISHRTAFLRLTASVRIELRSDEWPRLSFERSMSGQKSMTCLTVWFEYSQVQSGVTFGTLCRARNTLNPIFSVRSCVARELSALYRLSWRWRSFRVVTRTCPFCLGELVRLMRHLRVGIFGLAYPDRYLRTRYLRVGVADRGLRK
jgi:hypothetical protein